MLLVDIPAEAEPDVAALLAGELGIWGYRVLESRHRHLEVHHHTLDLELTVGGGVHRFPLHIKRVFDGGRFLRVKAEHDDLVRICAGLEEHGVFLAVLKARVESALGSAPPGELLALGPEPHTDDTVEPAPPVV